MSAKTAEFIAALSALLVQSRGRGSIQVVKEPKHTTNLFGPIEEVAGKRLELLDAPNFQGDCLCIFHGSRGANIVDVDHRDIEQEEATS